MKTILVLLITLAGAGATHAAQQVVVPNNLANVEGNSSVAEPFNSPSFRFQQVFDASQFAFPPGMSGRVDSISFRIDGASDSRVLLFFGGGSVSLSTTARGPDGLSPTFAENRGADVTTIFNGGLSFGGFVQPGASPQPFRETIQTFGAGTFFFDPSRGNLLLEVAGVDGQVFFPGGLDGHRISGDSISWVFANSNLTPAGTIDTFGFVARFDITIVPEPAVWQLILVSVLVGAILVRKTNHITPRGNGKVLSKGSYWIQD